MSTSSSEEKFLTLKCDEDGKVFTVKQSIAFQSVTIKNLIELDNGTYLRVPNVVESKTFAMVLDYLNYHGHPEVTDEEKEDFDNDFLRKYDRHYFDLLVAANFLEIQPLQDLIAQATADVISKKSVEEVREIFNIENDFTPEEEEAIRKEHPWAFNL